MKKIDYNQSDLSHVPKSIIYWVSQGVVIDGVRYAVKEFRVVEDKFRLVVEKNGEFFEVDASTTSGGSATIDPNSLKEYLKISDLGSGQGTEVRKLDSGVVVGLTDANIKRLDSVDTINEAFTRSNTREFYSYFNTYTIKGTPTGEADHTAITVVGHASANNEAYVDLDSKNHQGLSLFKYLMTSNESGVPLNKLQVVGTENVITLPNTLDDAMRVPIPLPEGKYLPGDPVVLRFDR